jgi:hypothetical protein
MDDDLARGDLIEEEKWVWVRSLTANDWISRSNAGFRKR